MLTLETILNALQRVLSFPLTDLSPLGSPKAVLSLLEVTFPALFHIVDERHACMYRKSQESSQSRVSSGHPCRAMSSFIWR